MDVYDLKNLTKFMRLGELAPEAFRTFAAFDAAAFKEGAVPVKYKELMAVAVGLATQCPYCIAVHTDRAKAVGASEPEIAEAVMVAAAILAGGTVAHGTHAVD